MGCKVVPDAKAKAVREILGMNIILKAESISRGVNRKVAIGLSGVGMILLASALVVDASMRTLFNMPILALDRIAEALLVWIIFAAFAYALITHAHVRVTLVVDRLPHRIRLGCEIFSNLVGLGFFAILTFVTWSYFWESWVIREVIYGPVRMPFWPIKLSMPVGFSFITVEFLIRLLHILRPKHEVVEEEEVAEF